MSQGAQTNAPDPGTDPEQATQTPPAAEPTTTDRPSGPPESIPYARFKEVNDELRPFKEITEFGYDADSLRQLAEWDANFTSDPVGNWLTVGKDLDLPEGVKAAIEAHENGNRTPQPPQAKPDDETPSDEDEPPPWAKELIEDKRAREQREREEAEEAEREEFDEMLQGVLQQWGEKDKADKLVDAEGNPLLTEEQMLDFVIAAAGRGGYENSDQLLEKARGNALRLRETYLKPAVQTRPNAPRPVPGGGSAPNEKPPPPKTLAEATARARAFMEGREE